MTIMWVFMSTQVTQYRTRLSCKRKIVEYCDMLFTIGASNNRALNVAPTHAWRYSTQRQKDADIFRRLKKSLRKTGSVISTTLANRRRPRIIQTSANEHAIIADMSRETLNLRDSGRQLGLCQATVLKLLLDCQLHPC
jgi:hypothetical protein